MIFAVTIAEYLTATFCIAAGIGLLRTWIEDERRLRRDRE